VKVVRRPDGRSGTIRGGLGVAALRLGEMRTRSVLQIVFRCACSRRARLAAILTFSLAATAVTGLSVRRFVTGGWPLAGGNAWLIAVAGLLFLLAFALKGAGWRRLLRRGERPGSHALAAANAAASVTGVALPGRLDDVVRIAVARRFSSRAGLGALCLSLVVVGLIDAAALTPLASVAAGVGAVSPGLRAGLAVVSAAGLAAGALVLALPRLSRSVRVTRFRLGRWLGRHATSRQDSAHAWAIVSVSWVVRALALYVLLGALAVGHSFPLALLFLTATAAASVLPVGPAGAATQVGAGAAALAAAGVPVSRAVAFGIAAQGLVVLAGAAVVVLAGAWEARLRLVAARA
jgi:uncharacterized membrane protein YbhN (UPF0104 family)